MAIKEHKEYVEEVSRKQADVDNVIVIRLTMQLKFKYSYNKRHLMLSCNYSFNVKLMALFLSLQFFMGFQKMIRVDAQRAKR